MCPQLPWRNIEVSGVSVLIGSLSTMQARPRPIGTPEPSGARWVSSPGTSPRLQTLAASAVVSIPAPCTNTQVAKIAARMR
jgi:hypothetical protein